VDNTGNIVGDVTNSERKPVPGDNVYLTLDTNLQVVLTKALTDEMNRIRREKRGAKNLTAAGVVMNCKTGEVLALVSLPSFDNNLFRGIGLTSKEDSDLEALLTAPSEVSPLLNRSISGLYPPGSTFKMIPALAALTEGKVRNGTAFNCAQYIYVPTSEDPANPNFRRKFKCWGRHGIQDVLGSIKNSCDVFYYNVGQEYEVSRLTGQPVGYFESPTTTQPFFPFNGVGIDKMNKYMELFQIGKRTGIELPGESAGFLPTKANYPILFPGGNWSVGDSLVTAIGQGNLLMTPLQLCSTTVALANSGKVLQPRIIKKVVDLNGNVKIPDEPVVKTEIQEKDIPRRHFQTIQLGMFQVTQAGGTAQSTMAGKMGRLEVAGKTGTAEYGDSIGKDAEDNLLFATYAWFTCYAPYRNPEIAVSILIATGDNVTEGATYAVPPAKTVLEAYFPNVTAPPTTPTVQPRP
jgi:penicillin-binding protein 2